MAMDWGVQLGFLVTCVSYRFPVEEPPSHIAGDRHRVKVSKLGLSWCLSSNSAFITYKL